MSEVHVATTAMVVMEPGSDWPGQVGDSTNLVAFGHGGQDLPRRTQAKVDAIRRGKQSLGVAVLACNADVGGAAALRRWQLARLLLDAVTRAPGGSLILSASARSTPQLRMELLVLTGRLTEELRGTTATVSLRFGKAADAAVARVVETPALSMTGTDA